MAQTLILDMILHYATCLIPTILSFITTKYTQEYLFIFGVDIMAMMILPILKNELTNKPPIEMEKEMYFKQYPLECGQKEIPYSIIAIILSLVGFLLLNNNIFSTWGELVYLMPIFQNGLLLIFYLLFLLVVLVLWVSTVEERFYNSHIDCEIHRSLVHFPISALLITLKWCPIVYYSIPKSSTFWVVLVFFLLFNLVICYVSFSERFKYGILMRQTFYFMIFCYLVFIKMASTSRGAPSSVYGTGLNIFNRLN